MAASYIVCQNLTFEETCDLFHFNKITAIFSETSNGVLHAGDMIAQWCFCLSLPLEICNIWRGGKNKYPEVPK